MGVVDSYQFLQEDFAPTSTINDFIASSQLVVMFCKATIRVGLVAIGNDIIL